MNDKLYVEYKMFIDELERRKFTVKHLLEAYEAKLKKYLTKIMRTEISYQDYLKTLQDRNKLWHCLQNYALVLLPLSLNQIFNNFS
ncbi:hypothetical protein [Actinobacillus porcinus]|uniref:hypothetical protein n=1 Tax=Actinobacillus porcinus TaxID=51048 RepID=UPI002353E123|nr:hypothetical protein [Actinobacillus porcinus]